MISCGVKVKEALKEGNTYKQYRVYVYESDGTLRTTIDNDNLVKESVKIDERMCSATEIKFGLAEGTEIDFQAFGVDNMTGCRLYVECDVTGTDGVVETIPIGWFTVKECSRQASTGIIKVSAYNKLLSDYLDQSANALITDAFPQGTTISLYSIREFLLNGFQIFQTPPQVSPVHDFSVTESVFNSQSLQFSAVRGVNAPINAYKYQQSVGSMPTLLSSTFTVTLNSNVYRYSLTSINYVNIDFLHGSIISFEKLYHDYLVGVLYGSKLAYSGAYEDDEYYIIDRYISNAAPNIYAGFLTIVLTVGLNSYRYCTEIYDYEERNGIAHTVAGRTYEAVYKLINTGGSVATIMIYLPSYIGVKYSSSSSAASELIYMRSDYDYSYYDSSSVVQAGSYSKLLYPDGETYTGTDPEDNYAVYIMDSVLSDADKITIDPYDIGNFTLRDIVSATFETLCQFGRLDRVTDLFSGKELSGTSLYPADDLYPSDTLYPQGESESGDKSMFSKLWADEGNVRSYRYLFITYKTTETDPDTQQEREVEKILQTTINENGTDDYYVDDNWIFKNIIMTDEQVEGYATAMATKMQTMKWFPFEMWCAGLPYLETGDQIEIPVGQSTYTSYILKRSLKGIQNLQDTFMCGDLDIF